jgi:hypothetical protein
MKLFNKSENDDVEDRYYGLKKKFITGIAAFGGIICIVGAIDIIGLRSQKQNSAASYVGEAGHDSGAYETTAEPSKVVNDFGGWYYNQLTENEQESYAQLYEQLSANTNTTSDYSDKIIRAVQYDNPLLYESSPDCEEALQRIIVDTNNMIDTYSKIKYLYDEIVNEASFDNSSEGNISALLNGSSSSYGFAATFKYLCSKTGLNAIIVDGSYSGNQHFWNLVEVEDTWYAVDCSLGRINFDELTDTFFTGYDYFLVDDSIIFTTHTADYYDYGWKYPGCTNGFYEYYRTNNLRFSEFSNAADYIVEEIQNGNTFITMAFTDDISYNEALYEIEVARDSKFWAYISYKTSIEYTSRYYTHNDDTRRISLYITS